MQRRFWADAVIHSFICTVSDELGSFVPQVHFQQSWGDFPLLDVGWFADRHTDTGLED